MKEILQQYAAHNLWASQRIIDTVSALPPEVAEKTINSSYSSVKLTLLHIWMAESIWWQRLKLLEVIVPPANENASIGEVAKGLMEQSKLWLAWVDKATTAALEHEFVYRNSKREQFKQPVWHLLMHIFNHATYHRGQVVTMLRQSGVENIPATDFIVFMRSKK